ncbi:MAG: chorismate synthase [Deltaproteobacteria bacterium]|nr:MAG: chorismate synthase [Deltaproteobacteria bacterium]
MPGNTFGKLFQVTTFGESHGPAIGAVVDGCPPQVALTEETIQDMLDRRRPGQGGATTPRKEPDKARLLSGVFEGKTTGTPIAILIENTNANANAYRPYAALYRPGHADITYAAKYGIRDWRGGGRASARETAGRVAAGAVARAWLNSVGVQVMAYTLELGGVRAEKRDYDVVHQNRYGSPDLTAAAAMAERVAAVKEAGDSIGGIVEIVASGLPAGIGDPVFDKLDADLAKAIMSIGAVKGVEIGEGFSVARMTGSENNDAIEPGGFASNHAGGILGGISNGDTIVVRAAVKPIPSIAILQKTIRTDGSPKTISVTGRHDVSPIPRINVVCEAMVVMTLADHLLRQRAICSEQRSIFDKKDMG